ncbi:hypothetical protein [Streptomyces griseomycini]|uniref:Uncharacterized protein n=1 Tax=Streptomyces griseomycini TaxID=66895 RepID=A0A7W7PWG3_9ACTN|nr:hypothetical protein [Streptomyces griseomycini]MBB4902544.1 hypothetical protein [Streptomyces griseomycini]GGR52312.1 hypothetical protein GCM10015536_67360 [Streptomyces griseomycini]
MRRRVVTTLIPQPDPEPAYPEYEDVRREARRRKGPFVNLADTDRWTEVARRRGGDWCAAVLGKGFPGAYALSTVDGWMLIVADERGLNPPLPARIVEDRRHAQEAKELREKQVRERQEREMRRWQAALAAAGVEMTVRENTRHTGVGGSLRHAVPKEELVSGQSRKHLADRGLCETPDRANPLHLGEPVNAPANCRRCLAYMEKVRTLDAPAPPTAAERKLLQVIASGVVFTMTHARCAPTIRVTTEPSRGRAGALGRSVDAAVKRLQAKGWTAKDAERSATQTGHSGHRWRLTEAGTAALEG